MDQAANWPVKFWDIDAAMASMMMLLAAVDEGLGGWFFGITHGERDLLDHLGVPEGLRPVGILGFGVRADDEEPSGSWMSRRRRPFEDQVHQGALVARSEALRAGASSTTTPSASANSTSPGSTVIPAKVTGTPRSPSPRFMTLAWVGRERLHADRYPADRLDVADATVDDEPRPSVRRSQRRDLVAREGACRVTLPRRRRARVPPRVVRARREPARCPRTRERSRPRRRTPISHHRSHGGPVRRPAHRGTVAQICSRYRLDHQVYQIRARWQRNVWVHPLQGDAGQRERHARQDDVDRDQGAREVRSRPVPEEGQAEPHQEAKASRHPWRPTGRALSLWQRLPEPDPVGEHVGERPRHEVGPPPG